MDYDKGEMASAYEAGRAYSPVVLQKWLDVLSRGIEGHQVQRILDLGCGTGRFSGALAEHFDAEVEAIDPSKKMLEQASRKSLPRVRFRRASGEELPLDDTSVDLVFMSMVFHHLASPELVAKECHRVLRPNGSVCLRNGTQEATANYPYIAFFPSSETILQTDLPSCEYITSAFAKAGLNPAHHEVVNHQLAANWKAYVEKLSHRADSILAQVSDVEFQAGIADLRKYAQSRPEAEPVNGLIDFFVFRE